MIPSKQYDLTHLDHKFMLQMSSTSPASLLISIGDRDPTEPMLYRPYSISTAAEVYPQYLEIPAILPTPAKNSKTSKGSFLDGGMSSHQTRSTNSTTTSDAIRIDPRDS